MFLLETRKVFQLLLLLLLFDKCRATDIYLCSRIILLSWSLQIIMTLVLVSNIVYITFTIKITDILSKIEIKNNILFVVHYIMGHTYDIVYSKDN